MPWPPYSVFMSSVFVSGFFDETFVLSRPNLLYNLLLTGSRAREPVTFPNGMFILHPSLSSGGRFGMRPRQRGGGDAGVLCSTSRRHRRVNANIPQSLPGNEEFFVQGSASQGWRGGVLCSTPHKTSHRLTDPGRKRTVYPLHPLKGLEQRLIIIQRIPVRHPGQIIGNSALNPVLLNPAVILG